MPRKLRPGKGRRDTIAHLSPATIGILLAGWGAEAPEPSAHGFAGGFAQLFEGQHAGIIRLWTAHRAALLKVAEVWGWTPQWDGVFFGEWISGGERNQG